jgi:hypothetical protein
MPVDWMYILVTMPVLAGAPGHITVMRMVDQASCLKQVATTVKVALESQDAFSQAFCLPKEDAAKFISAAHCHHPDVHYNPERLDQSCEGITKGP